VLQKYAGDQLAHIRQECYPGRKSSQRCRLPSVADSGEAAAASLSSWYKTFCRLITELNFRISGGHSRHDTLSFQCMWFILQVGNWFNRLSYLSKRATAVNQVIDKFASNCLVLIKSTFYTDFYCTYKTVQL
jgi:uncharacterized UPF0160 family protein